MDRNRSDVAVARDVPFRETPERTLRLDLYRPADGDAEAEKRDVAVAFVHGGAWREGSKGVLGRYALDAASAGFTCATVDYRLAHEATFPAQIRDVTAAVRWLRDRPDEYGGSDRVATVGHSSGAHLAALAAVAGDREAFVDGDDPDGDAGAAGRSDAAVGMSGVYDFVTPDGGFSDPDEFVDLFGGTADELPDVYREASPVSHVADAPPHLLFHGTDDELVPPVQSERYRDALVDAGADAEYVPVEGGGHSFVHATAHYGDTRDRLLEFLRGV